MVHTNMHKYTLLLIIINLNACVHRRQRFGNEKKNAD